MTMTLMYAVASTRVQSWGGRNAEGGVVCSAPHWEHPLPTRGRSLGGVIFLFCDLKMAYFGEFWGTKFKVFLYRELPQWGLG